MQRHRLCSYVHRVLIIQRDKEIVHILRFYALQTFKRIPFIVSLIRLEFFPSGTHNLQLAFFLIHTFIFYILLEIFNKTLFIQKNLLFLYISISKPRCILILYFSGVFIVLQFSYSLIIIIIIFLTSMISVHYNFSLLLSDTTFRENFSQSSRSRIFFYLLFFLFFACSSFHSETFIFAI